MHLLITCLLVWACATASASAALLIVVAVQSVARVLRGHRAAPPHVVPQPRPAVSGSREMART